MANLLVIGKGDTQYSDRNRTRFVECAKNSGFNVQQCDYHEIRGLKGFRGERVNVMLFFPYTFWNANCEVPSDTVLYGTSGTAYGKFRDFFLETGRQLGRQLGEGRLHYPIPPEKAFVDRDKVETIAALRQGGIPTPDSVQYAGVEDLIGLACERGIFIKCRYGAEGKGITALRDGRWVTNYKVEGSRLANYGIYDKWPFSDITGRKDLLGQLLQNDVIVEWEILVPNVFDGLKFDLRAYVVGERVPHLFIRLNGPENIITNFSQGASIRHHPDTGIAEGRLDATRVVAAKAAKAMGLGFVGVDMMFDKELYAPLVVEAQAFADFPDIGKFNLASYLVDRKNGLLLQD